MNVYFQGELRRIEKNEFKRRNGESACDFRLLVEQGSTSVTFTGAQNLEKKFDEIKTMQGALCDFDVEYHPNWKYNQFVISDVNLCC